MSISVITTNVFPRQEHVSRIINNLGVQTTKDFEWIFVDAFHKENSQLVNELTQKYKIATIHVPACGATHVGRVFHWELYNNAVLLSNYPSFLRLGVHRYFHRNVVAVANEMSSKNTWISLRQQCIESLEPEWSYGQIEERFSLETDTRKTKSNMESHCGMFSFSRQQMLDMNGNNEALLIHHFEDCDLNSRWTQLGKVTLVTIENAFLRLWHVKVLHPPDHECNGQYIGKFVCDERVNPKCIYHIPYNQRLDMSGRTDLHWFKYHGVSWAKCDQCGTIAVGNEDKYFEFLRTDPLGFKAPINVDGVGRNITTLNSDLSKLTSMQSKVELLSASHTDPRYLI